MQQDQTAIPVMEKEWPNGATVKIRFIRASGAEGEIGWARRGQKGELVSAPGMMPLDASKWEVLAERDAALTDVRLMAEAFSRALSVAANPKADFGVLFEIGVHDAIARHDLENPACKIVDMTDEAVLAAALKDVLNAADAGAPYSAEELCGSEFSVARIVANKHLNDGKNGPPDLVLKDALLTTERALADSVHHAMLFERRYHAAEALRTIAAQTTGSDWTDQQAMAFVKQHARQTINLIGADKIRRPRWMK
ncbi:hypothetical protein [Burkholderia sp. Ac-20365]|uniref:hypothetical protein n=1 Tax=Burkholderia sp. Ac-20365 TaxID=2703897 RepID=UPI00197B90B3|nr:hypothetical protein [Burkholderia sp. Ac-20365]MBN3761381.1 hypothetical protein [Burkholderia sp. Ac-20365]